MQCPWGYFTSIQMDVPCSSGAITLTNVLAHFHAFQKSGFFLIVVEF
jgi:hypothetical protein